eukprot:10026188-Prorocentrum_lima.AAC.1
MQPGDATHPDPRQPPDQPERGHPPTHLHAQEVPEDPDGVRREAAQEMDPTLSAEEKARRRR